MAIFSPSRCVLLLSDEGINIYDAGGSRTSLLDMIPWETADFEDAIADVVRKKCRGKSIVLLNDMVEQHYRKERVPKISAMDRANLIKRRLTAAFPTYPIRAALKLKEKPPQQNTQLAPGDIYLFGAVPLSANISNSLAAVKKTHATLSGFALLPVESSGMVQAISKKLTKPIDKQSVWTVFVGQHRNGGLRQIVTKNGELALTRMTPLMDSTGQGEQWAFEVAGEIKGTMGYLSRFGFDQRDGLDVIVIASNAAAESITSKIDFDCNLHVLTNTEAAGHLKLSLGPQDTQHYADAIHVSWTARKSALAMSLQSPQLNKIAQPVKIAMAASLVLLLTAGYFGYEAFNQASAWSSNTKNIEAANAALAATREEHAAEVERKASVGVDFLLIERSTQVYDQLEPTSMRPLPVIDLIGRSLGADIHIKGMEIKPSTNFASPAADTSQAVPVDPSAPPAPIAIPRQKYDIVISISFPAALAPEKGVQEISALEQRLRSNLPNHEVKVIKQVADLSYTGNFVGEATSKIEEIKNAPKKEDYEAQILIRGELI